MYGKKEKYEKIIVFLKLQFTKMSYLFFEFA